MSKEPILSDNPNRFVMFPIHDNDIWDAYKKHMDCFWRAEEIDFSKDEKHWKTLTNKEQYFIKMVLAYKTCFTFIKTVLVYKKCFAIIGNGFHL